MSSLLKNLVWTVGLGVLCIIIVWAIVAPITAYVTGQVSHLCPFTWDKVFRFLHLVVSIIVAGIIRNHYISPTKLNNKY